MRGQGLAQLRRPLPCLLPQPFFLEIARPGGLGQATMPLGQGRVVIQQPIRGAVEVHEALEGPFLLISHVVEEPGDLLAVGRHEPFQRPGR